MLFRGSYLFKTLSLYIKGCWFVINSLRPRQNGCLFADDTFKCILLNENIWIAINISLSFVPKGPIDNIPALVQIMAWRRSGDKPLSEPMMVSLLTHICVIRPQWVNLMSGTVFFKQYVHTICYTIFNVPRHISGNEISELMSSVWFECESSQRKLPSMEYFALITTRRSKTHDDIRSIYVYINIYLWKECYIV